MKKILFLLLCLGLFGCATGYHKEKFTGGYTDIKLQDDIFKINFRGNAFIDRDSVENFALLRCAEVTLENGYKYFIIIEGKSDIKTNIYTSPATAETYGVSYGGVYQGTTYVHGRETYVINKPITYYVIKCFKEKPESLSTIIFDAEQLKDNIRKQYRLY